MVDGFSSSMLTVFGRCECKKSSKQPRLKNRSLSAECFWLLARTDTTPQDDPKSRAMPIVDNCIKQQAKQYGKVQEFIN